MMEDPYLRQLQNANNQLHSLNNKANLSIALEAAQVLQEQRIIQQNKQLIRIQNQQLRESRIFNYKMWIQTSDGVVYQGWLKNAAKALSAIDAFDEAWRGAWNAEVDGVLSARERWLFNNRDHIPKPLALKIKQLLHPAVLGSVALPTFVLTVLAAFGTDNLAAFGTGYWILLCFLAAQGAALTWSVLYRDPTDYQARERTFAEAQQVEAAASLARRVAHFGYDPLSHGPPVWSLNGEHLEIARKIRHMIEVAPTTFPQPDELPSLASPKCVDRSNVALNAHRILLSIDYFQRL